MNKKVIGLLGAIVALLVSTPTFASNVSFDIVLQRLNIKGMTQYTVAEDFRANDSIQRGEAAKMLTQFAKLFELPESFDQCSFDDIAGYDYTLEPFITEVCSYGILKGGAGKFTPRGNLTEAQAIAIVSRALGGFKDETKSPRYLDYFNHLQSLGILENETLSSVNDKLITRQKLGTWLFVADKSRDIEDSGSIGVSMNITDKEGNTTDVSGKIGVEVEQEEKVSGLMPHSSDMVEKALLQGQQVVLYFRAARCPLCQALDADLEANETDIPENLVIFTLDYDTESQLKRDRSVSSQHTLIYLDNKGNELYKNVKQEVTLQDIIDVITSGNQ